MMPLGVMSSSDIEGILARILLDRLSLPTYTFAPLCAGR
jgi:hypothetical protein